MIESEVNHKRLGGRARLEARRCGLLARKHSAAAGFMLVEPYTERVVHGNGYTLSALQVFEYCEDRRRKQGAQVQR
jgi:hypothetical protein